jgi:hypothetical protein
MVFDPTRRYLKWFTPVHVSFGQQPRLFVPGVVALNRSRGPRSVSALEAGAMKVGRVALDGTKIKANASKHKAMSYGRMEGKEQAIQAEVKHLLAQAEATDAEEDARYDRDRVARRGWQVAEVRLTGREERPSLSVSARSHYPQLLIPRPGR